MMRILSGSTACLILLGGLTLGLVPEGGRADKSPAVAETTADGPADFTRQIRPILSEYCFACHGPDEKTRKAKLRLDTKEGAAHVLAPGKPDESELIYRVTSSEPTEVMPPPRTGKKPKPEEIELLRRWVREGANWSEHWAFVAPQKPALPAVKDRAWPRGDLDHFILARLEKAGLKPSAEADKVTLIRRVTLDLTGLPPTPKEVDAYLADASPQAFEKVVDRLLQSPRFGEHMARFWLDAARYGDTHGLHLDNYREMWSYRDWVVRAFNANMPHDRFVVEQLAGDLLPDPTVDQLIATGFNRCHVTTSEGGSIEEECFVRNVSDRVETTGTVFMGLTIGCARCHDHKFDPLTQKDYYSFFAFFNSLDGKPLDGNAARHPPILHVPSPDQGPKLADLRKREEELRQRLADEVAKIRYDESADKKEPETLPAEDYVWIDDAVPEGAKTTPAKWDFVSAPEHPVRSGKLSHTRTADGLSQHAFEKAPKGLRVGNGDRLFAYVYLSPENPPKAIMLQWNTGQWNHRGYWGENIIPFGADNTPQRRPMGPLPKPGEWVRLEVNPGVVGLKPGAVVTGWAFTQHDGTVHWDSAGIRTQTPQSDTPFETLTAWVRAEKASGGTGLPPHLQPLVKLDRAKRTSEQQKELLAYFLENVYAKAPPAVAEIRKQLQTVVREREAIEKAMPSTLIWKELKQPRPAYVLKRGEYDQRGEEVSRATPASLPPLPADAPRDRLGLARWLVSREHPLTARVAVNRFWQQFFGTGIVKTAEDFGVQGEPPSHPELLDRLAVQFVEDGWNVKKLVRRIVTSAAYRQSAKLTPDRLAKDPANRLLSRGPRFRLDAEMLRDQALFVSGLLIEKVGGPSVKPPQPAGLWEAVGYTSSNTRNFVADTGAEKVHRRSLYIFLKRTAPPPQMTTFDAPSREACTIRRERTNTPLQALLLMNETQYVECARALAERAMKQGGKSVEDRIAFLFRHATARKPDATEKAALAAAYAEQLQEYREDVEAARKLIAVGESKPDAALDPAELAAWTMVANVLLNLDEVLNKG